MLANEPDPPNRQECYQRAALARSAVKVELSRAATALLHSEAALAPGDLTRAGTARAAAADVDSGTGASSGDEQP